jgi:hypothetical protein
MSLSDKMDSVRKLLDVNTSDCDLDSLANHAQQLSAMIGLSSECKAEARMLLESARLVALKMYSGDKKITPSIILKMADGACAEQIQVYEYADRINAGITHKLDTLRTIISLRKTELENSRFQS